MSVQISSNRVNVDELVENNLHLVIFTIRNFFHTSNTETQKEMESAGRVGLVKAALSYDPDRAAFSTYAVYRIRGEISNFLKRQAKHQNVVSLDQEFGEGLNLHSVISDDSASFEMDATERVDVERLLSHLSEKERNLIERYFGIGRTQQNMRQIATDLGVTHRTIWVRIQAIMAKLRQVVGVQP
jgi:RNA polymerase sigma factor (sigma-70 family)